jgi:hypothetical protein
MRRRTLKKERKIAQNAHIDKCAPLTKPLCLIALEIWFVLFCFHEKLSAIERSEVLCAKIMTMIMAAGSGSATVCPSVSVAGMRRWRQLLLKIRAMPLMFQNTRLAGKLRQH